MQAQLLGSDQIRKRLDPGLALVLVLALFNIAPLASNPGLPNGTDALYHSFRAAEMWRSWEQGLLAPSWAEGFYFGYGSPLFHFYASLTYYLTSVFHFVLGLGALEALRWLLLGCLLAGGGGMYLFCRRRSGRLGAVIAGLLYVYSPYLMFTEAYARGAYPELLAFALFPLLLWRVDALRDKPGPLNFLAVALLQVALINAHNLMALTLTGIGIAWVAFESAIQHFNREASQLKPRAALLTLLAMLLGILLSASFWLPLLLESDSAHLENLTAAGLLDYHRNFVRFSDLLSSAPMHDAGAINGLRELRVLGVAQWIAAVTGALGGAALYLRGYRTRHPQAYLGAVFFGLLALALICLMTPASSPVWAGLRPLRFLQFPWRLLGPAAACLAIVASMNGHWLARLDARYQLSMIALVIALPIATAFPLLYVPEWRHTRLDASIGAYHEEELAGRQLGTTFTDEFRPRDAHTTPAPTLDLLADYADGYPIDKLNRASLPAGVTAEFISNSPQSLAWRIRASEAVTLEIYNFYWLGWRAEADGRALSIGPSANHGLITVAAPAGDYSLRVYLASTPARDVAAAVSMAAALVLLFIVWRLRKRSETARPYWTAPQLTRTQACGILLGGGMALLVFAFTFREGVAWLNSPPGLALPAQIQRRFTLDDRFQLLGYDISAERLRAGDRLTVAAYWRALSESDIDFSSFLHLSSGGPPHAQVDKPHPGGRAVSEWWHPGGYVFDAYALEIPARLPAGDYDLILGLYTCELMPADDCGNGYRPSVRDENGDLVGDSVKLATIRVDER